MINFETVTLFLNKLSEREGEKKQRQREIEKDERWIDKIQIQIQTKKDIPNT